jgi:hypothetical protein
MQTVRALASTVTLVALGCGSLKSHVNPPPELVCNHIVVASEALEDALTKASPKDCVVLAEGSYTGSFVLPADVSLAGSEGATVVLKGDGSSNPVLTVHSGSTVVNIKIDTSAGSGIAIDPGPANLMGVSVTGADQSALTSTCSESDCAGRTVTLTDVELEKSGTGLLVAGATVDVVRGHITQMNSLMLAGGSGVVATKGARLSMHSTQVAQNIESGVLIDGASTLATLEGCDISGNGERGLWIQNITDGGVFVDGGTFNANSVVGVGILQAGGVQLSGVTISGTQLKDVMYNIGGHALIGDGVGFFSGAHDVRLDRISATDNGRVQIIADKSGAEIHVPGPLLEAPDGGYHVVVQRMAQPLIEVPPDDIDVLGVDLPVSADPIPLQ